MRIKRLDITGFKSFMDRAVFTFDEGITGVVGPNGCGKSNVVDAIRWVMGEQSAKNLRGRGMEDVIFNGSETHQATSMAEVTLTFAVDETDVLPPSLSGLPEVSVTRRLFRSGESEYAINKTNGRLLDITELFLGTGVGTRAYSIIEQGRVGQIVSSRPEDRRSFIEEAAGVTKYKARRKAAERKMEHTQGNLLRVNDIVSELEKRVEQLERQAKKAEKYRKVKDEVRVIELQDFAMRYLELMAAQKTQSALHAQLSDEERAAVDAVRDAEESIVIERSRLETEARELESMSDDVHAVESSAQLDLQRVRHLTGDIESTKERLAQSEADQADIARKSAELTQERQKKTEDVEGFSTSVREDEVALEVREEELTRLQELERSVEQELTREQSEVVAVSGRRANVEATLLGVSAHRTETLHRAERLSGELDVLGAEERALEQQRAEVLTRVDQSRQLKLELERRRGHEEEELARSRESFAENEVFVIALREELADRRSRYHSLEELERNYEGYDRGVRAVMQKAQGQLAEYGLLGLVSDVLRAPPEFEKAIEAALGEKLQAVLVESPARAAEWVGRLKELAEGRSTFMPANVGPDVTLLPLASPDIVAMAVDRVSIDNALAQPLVSRLLNGVVLVNDWASAERAAAQAGPGYTFVTVDGEVLAPFGVATGGALEGPAVGVLQKKREMADLKTDIARLEERYNEVVTRHYALQKHMGHSEGVLKGLSKNEHAEALTLATGEKDLHQAGSTLSRVRERRASLETERAELVATGQDLERQEEALKGEVAHAQADASSREERLRLLLAEAESLKVRVQSQSEGLTSLKVAVASARERTDAARAALVQAEAQLVDLNARMIAAQDSIAVAKTKLATLEADLAETQARLEKEEARLAQHRALLESRREQHSQSIEALHARDAEVRGRRERLDAVAHGLSEVALKERELKLELDHLASLIDERYHTTAGEAVSEFHLSKPLRDSDKDRLKELKSSLERMGEVNLSAIDELKEVSERYQFLSRQKVDLESSIEQLQEAIRRIDKTSRERFQQTFEVVNEKFQAIFPRLFGGGRAALVLTAEQPGMEAGVEIIAQPPGKKLQSVGLLSGGEKALTAVAMIFAIFLIKPTPFCLLDEVDAPLDEANVGRYNDMVREMSGQSQFILITHNKRTMEVADSLYGVTMEEPGVSKLVSVRLKESAAAAANTQATATPAA